MAVQSSTRKPLRSRTNATVWPQGFTAGSAQRSAPAVSARSKAEGTSSTMRAISTPAGASPGRFVRNGWFCAA